MEIKIEKIEDIVGCVKIGDMLPLQIGTVVSGFYEGRIVMRTASSSQFEVFQLTDPCVDRCWSGKHQNLLDLSVKLFPKGTKLNLTITV
jgi:hypothetical protein